MTESNKYEKLFTYLKKLGNAAIAFSGGVDSTFLVAIAKEALGNKAIALTVASPYIAKWEIEEALELTDKLGVTHKIITLPMLDSIRHNPENRCYVCKKAIFSRLLIETEKAGFTNLLDGTNCDDLGDYRPGLKALKELNILSPFVETGFTKKDIRHYSEKLNLPTWNKPAYACLLTRLPYNHEITEEEIQRIELSEKFLMDIGFKAVRIRSHGDLARIEVPAENRKDLIAESTSKIIADKLKEFGYNYVTIDILGYRMGSFNEKIKNNS